MKNHQSKHASPPKPVVGQALCVLNYYSKLQVADVVVRNTGLRYFYASEARFPEKVCWEKFSLASWVAEKPGYRAFGTHQEMEDWIAMLEAEEKKALERTNLANEIGHTRWHSLTLETLRQIKALLP